jgi:hypothetical protein
MNDIGVAAERHEVGGRLKNRAENSHQPLRRREPAMQRFRSLKTLQKFSSVRAQVHSQFNQERHLVASKSTSRDARCLSRVARPCGVDCGWREAMARHPQANHRYFDNGARPLLQALFLQTSPMQEIWAAPKGLRTKGSARKVRNAVLVALPARKH